MYVWEKLLVGTFPRAQSFIENTGRIGGRVGGYLTHARGNSWEREVLGKTEHTSWLQ